MIVEAISCGIEVLPVLTIAASYYMKTNDNIELSFPNAISLQGLAIIWIALATITRVSAS